MTNCVQTNQQNTVGMEEYLKQKAQIEDQMDYNFIKRIIQEAKENGTLIDATHGRRTRAVIITDSDHIILTYLQAETLSNRLENENTVIDGEDYDE